MTHTITFDMWFDLGTWAWSRDPNSEYVAEVVLPAVHLECMCGEKCARCDWRGFLVMPNRKEGDPEEIEAYFGQLEIVQFMEEMKRWPTAE